VEGGGEAALALEGGEEAGLGVSLESGLEVERGAVLDEGPGVDEGAVGDSVEAGLGVSGTTALLISFGASPFFSGTVFSSLFSSFSIFFSSRFGSSFFTGFCSLGGFVFDSSATAASSTPSAGSALRVTRTVISAEGEAVVVVAVVIEAPVDVDVFHRGVFGVLVSGWFES
jgi:hypothetical protein